MSGNRVYDPSKLHLKKELTQIRKAARVLRDPGTTSSWKSPLSSTRSVHAAFFASYDGGASRPVQENPLFTLTHSDLRNAGKGNRSGNRTNEDEGRDKEKRVFLYNWRANNKSSSEKSLGRLDLDGNSGKNDDDGSTNFLGSVASASLDDSLSDAKNNGADSKSDTYISDIKSLRQRRRLHHGGCDVNDRRHRVNNRRRRSHGRGHQTAADLRCRETLVTSPTVMGKMKFRKPPPYSTQKHRQKRLRQLANDRDLLNFTSGVKVVAPSNSIALSQDDSLSLVDQSDDYDGFYSSEDVRQSSATSPLLSRLMHKNTNASSKFLRGHRREDSSYTFSTPALSASSFNRYLSQMKPSTTVGSWDGTTASYNDIDDVLDGHLDLPDSRRCGIPCYWSRKTPKHRGGSGSGCSPSLSDTLRRTGSRLICGSQTVHKKCPRSLPRASKQRDISTSVQGRIPLLSSCDGGASSLGTGNSDDELLMNFGEIDLEGMSRLDGRRWSTSCRSQEGLESMAFGADGQEEALSDSSRSLSQRYRPMFFSELVGQNIVVQSLMTSISRGKIAPVYLFQGPRGTGKTSTARIFAAALNCLAVEGTKPCGVCTECSDFVSFKSRDLLEVDAKNKKGIDKIRFLLKSQMVSPSSGTLRYKVFVIDECHLLPSKTWLSLIKFLEHPLPQVVFVFITTDVENVPRTALSRCQRYLFNKIKDCDIVEKLQKISDDESLDVDSDALELIALNADGSLRDAETMLEQLSLLGKKITTSLVNELVGVVSDEKLLELLELAISSNTAETVKKARELLDSGADPLVLMSQLASLIMDIIAGSNLLNGAKDSMPSYSGQNLTVLELQKLKRALKLLSEAEKQLRVSSERSTWFTATLLQLGSVTSPDLTLSGSSRRQSSRTTDEDQSTASRDAVGHGSESHGRIAPGKTTSSGKGDLAHQDVPFSIMDDILSNCKVIQNQSVHSVDSVGSADDVVGGSIILTQTDMEKLDCLWLQCIRRCHYDKLRQLLKNHGKLVSISEADGVLLAYIAFGDEKIKARAERYVISITNSFEAVLRHSVEVRIILLPDILNSKVSREQVGSPNDMLNKGETVGRGEENLDGSLFLDRGSVVRAGQGGSEEVGNRGEKRPELPMQRVESIIREQRLETAWLQAVEKGTPRSMSRLRPERNQVLPQDVGRLCHRNQVGSTSSLDLTSHDWEDELNREITVLKVTDKKDVVEKDQQAGKRIEHLPISPSLLHQNACVGSHGKEHLGYESGPQTSGCNMLFCWNTRHRRAEKVKHGDPMRSQKGRFSCFRDCRKSRRS